MDEQEFRDRLLLAALPATIEFRTRLLLRQQERPKMAPPTIGQVLSDAVQDAERVTDEVLARREGRK